MDNYSSHRHHRGSKLLYYDTRWMDHFCHQLLTFKINQINIICEMCKKKCKDAIFKISSLKWLKTTWPLIYIWLCFVFPLAQMPPAMFKPREIHNFIQDTRAFHLISYRYNFQINTRWYTSESEEGSRRTWPNITYNLKKLPCLCKWFLSNVN